MPDSLSVKTDDFGFSGLVDRYARVDEPRHRDAQKLLDYWTTCIARSGDFVVGRDIPARPIAALLRNIVVCEPLPDSTDLKVRLAGDMARRRFNGDIKGARLSELFSGQDLKHHLAASFDVIRTRHPITIDSSLKRGDIEEMHFEILVLPVTAPERNATWLLVGMFFFG